MTDRFLMYLMAGLCGAIVIGCVVALIFFIITNPLNALIIFVSTIVGFGIVYFLGWAVCKWVLKV